MDANALVLAGVALVAGAFGAAAARRMGTERMRGLTEAARRAEGELRSRDRSSAEGRRVQDVILGAMQDGVLLLDREGRTVFANASLARLLGAPGGRDPVLPVDLERAARRAGYTGAETSAEVEAGRRWLRGSAIPVGDDGSVLLVVRDVTEALRLDSIRRDFVANASHELKTPAASIRAAAETIRSAIEEDPAAVPRFAESIERESVRLTRIVSDLLDLSRLESGSDLHELVRLDVLALDECRRFQETASSSRVELEVKAQEVPAVRGSARDLALLVRNLVDNAIRYTKAGGRVEVSVSSDDGHVRIGVTDTGIGIPTRDLPRVFERFYRVDRARSRETGGTGLGLAIVKHVVENHDGEVSVQSELGQGTTVTARLPVA
ncbi:MAG: GHKL domain-containing protein [Actinobacteria bacterium]|nr:GHKL domain-containing protein [Actinomycetota bacterium]